MAPNRHNQTLVEDVLFLFPEPGIPDLRSGRLQNHEKYAVIRKPTPHRASREILCGVPSPPRPTSAVKSSSPRFLIQNAQKPRQTQRQQGTDTASKGFARQSHAQYRRQPMNNHIQLEQWLCSLKLHGPSPELKHRLFDHAAPQPQALPKKAATQSQLASWMAAAAACALIVTGLSRPTTSEVLFWSPAGHTLSLATAAFNNQFCTAYHPGSHSLRNPSLPAKLKWTNSGSLPSTKSFGVHSKTIISRQ